MPIRLSKMQARCICQEEEGQVVAPVRFQCVNLYTDSPGARRHANSTSAFQKSSTVCSKQYAPRRFLHEVCCCPAKWTFKDGCGGKFEVSTDRTIRALFCHLYCKLSRMAYEVALYMVPSCTTASGEPRVGEPWNNWPPIRSNATNATASIGQHRSDQNHD